MAISPKILDLSKLPVPDLLLAGDPNDIFRSWLARLRELDPTYDALVESDPVYKQGEVLAYQSTLLMQRVNDAIRGVLLASARKADLDQLGAGFNVARLEIAAAQPDAIPPLDAVLEEDEAFRARIQLSWSQLNTAGSRDAYRFHAKSADADVLDAECYGPETHGRPGEIDVYILSRTGNGFASAALLDKVSAALNEDETRPLSDYVRIAPAAISHYGVTAQLDIPEGPDPQLVLNNAFNELEKYLKTIHRIEAEIPLSGIYHALHQPGVKQVHLLNPTMGIESDIGVAPYCIAIDISLYQGDKPDDVQIPLAPKR
ncbi:baseplate J/gp47 family protein [Rouxiella sp. T17]|uniref:baseplate assembly protein n=1 Tax=Rouxiella sp. T17 TaxID=3085684 RepID=UPI002FCAFB77